jgi:type II secretory pathway pseudopilin PulG
VEVEDGPEKGERGDAVVPCCARGRAHSDVIYPTDLAVGHALRCAPPATSRPQTSQAAFTMVEIAICLAVIGFALVAIIGILPTGMNVQKENREQTIINQEANFFMTSIRQGAREMDDLTNYVVAITNYWRDYDVTATATNPTARQGSFGYTYLDSSTTPKFPLTNGTRIIGLLSMPKYTSTPSSPPPGFTSNHIVAFVRAISGNASEKAPQNNNSIQGDAFSYRMISEVLGYSDWDREWTNYTAYLNPPYTAADWQWRSNYWLVARNQQANLRDLRLTFRWPLLPNGDGGPNRASFRALTGGILVQSNANVTGTELYFFQPQTYVQKNP